jgi:hypothetical protein
MELIKTLLEDRFNTYTGMIRITVPVEVNKMEIGEMIRAIPGVTTVTPSGEDKKGRIFYKVKIITNRKGTDAYKNFKSLSLQKVPQIRKLDIAFKTIEKKR